MEDKFKLFFENYINNRSMDTENQFLRGILFDFQFLNCIGKEDGGLEVIRTETGKLVLFTYTSIEEIKEETRNTSNIYKFDFDTLVENINSNRIDELCINPRTNKFILTSMQLMNLQRQKLYNKTSEPITLSKDNNFLKPAYKVRDITIQNSSKIIELYDKYLKEQNDENLSDFYDELVNHATFYSFVFPAKDASHDENGNPMITKERVLQYVKEEKSYLLYVSTEKISELSDDEYVSRFNFFDYIKLIDSNYGEIKNFNIIGDIKLKIPSNIFDELKIQKDRFIRNSNNIVLSNNLNKENQDDKNIINNLKEFFVSFSNIKTVYGIKDIYSLKSEKFYSVYKIIIETTDTVNKDEITNKICQILENRCCDISYINNATENTHKSLANDNNVIYEKLLTSQLEEKVNNNDIKVFSTGDNKKDKKFNQVIELFKKTTQKECYKIFCLEEEPTILDDKIAGTPYIPIGEEYPTDKDGNPLALLIQVNLKNIELEGYPKKGILEIFANVDYPCQYSIKYFDDNQEYRKDLPVISPENYITTKPIKIGLKKDICHMGLEDYRFLPIMIKIVNEVYNTNIKNYSELDKELKYIKHWYDLLYNEITIHDANLGGYPDFTQSDPRYRLKENYDECLIKIDSNLSQNIMIGDAGIIFALISKDNIEKLSFEKGFVDWDCS